MSNQPPDEIAEVFTGITFSVFVFGVVGATAVVAKYTEAFMKWLGL